MSSPLPSPSFRLFRTFSVLSFMIGSLFGLTGVVHADSWAPFAGIRVVDSDGRRYVVVRPNPEGENPIFEIVSVAEGAPPITRAEGVKAKVRPGDRLLQRGECPMTPLNVVVLPTGYGFVMIDQYGWLGHGSTVVFVDDRGGVGPVLDLDDLFTEEEQRQFSRTTSSIHWREGQWIDSERKLLIVSSAVGGRAIDWIRGEVRALTLDDFARAFELKDPKACAMAMEILQPKMDPAWTLLPAAIGVLTDPSSGRYVRLRAASLVARYDRVPRKKNVSEERMQQLAEALPVARELVRITAFGPADAVPRDDRYRAILSSGRVLGTAAIPHLRNLAREGTPYGGAMRSAFLDLGSALVPTLVEMVHETDARVESRTLAADLLSEVGISDHYVHLVDLIADPNPYVANAAANTAIRLGGKRAAVQLADHLERGTTQDLRLARYFAIHRCPEAVPALLKCLERTTRKTTRSVTVQALRYQTGKDLGDDPKEWRKELAK